MSAGAVRGMGVIARLTFQEARRRRTALAAVVLGIIFLTLFLLGSRFIITDMQAEGVPEQAPQFAQHVLVMVGFYVVHFLTIMLAIFSSSGAIASEIASHTIQTIVTKPLRRRDVVLGKWLGQALMILLYLALLGGGVLVGVYLQTGFSPPGAFHALGLIALEAVVLVALSLLFGTRLSTMATGVILFLAYGLAFIGAWVGQLGALFQSPAAIRVGLITAAVLPVEALWRRAAFLMQPPMFQALPFSPFTGGAPPGPRIEVYAILYAAAVLALAVWAFERRDL